MSPLVAREDIRAAARITRVTQSRVDPVHGDCFRASVASALGLALDDVPDYRYGGSQPGAPGVVLTPADERARERWWSYWHDWFRARNLFPCEFGKGPDGTFWLPPGIVTLGTVVSPRGCYHSVVCVDGAVVWDPSPTQDCYDLPLVRHLMFVVIEPARVSSAVEEGR